MVSGALGAPRGVGAIRGCWRASGGVWGVRGILGAGRECRYSGARRGIGGIRGHWGLLRGVGGVGEPSGHQGCRGCQACIGGWQGV